MPGPSAAYRSLDRCQQREFPLRNEATQIATVRIRHREISRLRFGDHSGTAGRLRVIGPVEYGSVQLRRRPQPSGNFLFQGNHREARKAFDRSSAEAMTRAYSAGFSIEKGYSAYRLQVGSRTRRATFEFTRSSGRGPPTRALARSCSITGRQYHQPFSTLKGRMRAVHEARASRQFQALSHVRYSRPLTTFNFAIFRPCQQYCLNRI